MQILRNFPDYLNCTWKSEDIRLLWQSTLRRHPQRRAVKNWKMSSICSVQNLSGILRIFLMRQYTITSFAVFPVSWSGRKRDSTRIISMKAFKSWLYRIITAISANPYAIVLSCGYRVPVSLISQERLQNAGLWILRVDAGAILRIWDWRIISSVRSALPLRKYRECFMRTLYFWSCAAGRSV